MSRSVRVSIAGCNFSVRTDAKPSYVRELAAHVELKMSETQGKGMSTQTQLLMTAMSITDDLFQQQADHKELKREVRERSIRILNTLERETKS